MTDPLSLSEAARAAPRAIALHAGEKHLTFSQLHDHVQQRLQGLPDELVEGRFVPLTGSNTLQVAVTLYALLQARVPALLLHPKLTAAERAAEIAATARAAPRLPGDAAVIVHTSGTTGAPRGAVLTRQALLASAAASAANLGWQPDDCWLLAMPLARVGGLSILTRCLAARRAVALMPQFDAAAVPAWLERYRCTLASMVPTMLALVLEEHPAWQPPPFLRAVLVGGAAASARLLEQAARRRVPIVITYGCTETCSQVVATPYPARWQPAACGAGRPLQGAELRLVEGHVQMRGPMRMASYLGAPALATEEWFDTGDLGEFDAAGCLHLRGRAGDLIVSGGEKVHPAEVEHALERCPGIRAAAVFGLPDETWGEIVAAVLVADGEPPSDAALLAHLAAELGRHKRPRRVAFVERLPHSAAGKLDRAALAHLADALRPLRAID